MFSVIPPIAHIVTLVWTLLTMTAGAASLTPVMVDRATGNIPDCNGVCDGYFGEWTHWGECADSECHLKHGTQTRQTYCYVKVVAPPSRSDGGSRQDSKPADPWHASCRKIEVRPCVQKLTCDGMWGKWGSWTECEKSNSEDSARCSRSRRRLCKDIGNNRLPGSHCYGGAMNDTTEQPCKEECLHEMTRQHERTITPVESSEEKKDQPTKTGQNTMLIIAVAVGSLVFGAVFVLLLLNVARRSSSSTDDDSTSSQNDRWKRIGSLNTSSTMCSAGYVTASDVMSPRADLRDIQSPCSSTTGSGNSSLQIQFFGRSEVRSPNDMGPGAPLLTVSGAVKENEGRPRRSRLLQENIYWEISDQQVVESSSFSDSSVEAVAVSDERSSSLEENGQLVDNVLYGSRV